MIDNVMAGDLISKKNESVRQKLISMEYAMEAAEKPDSVVSYAVLTGQYWTRRCASH